MKAKQQPSVFQIATILCYLLFLLMSFIFGFEPGQQIGANFLTYALTMLKMLPFAFVLCSVCLSMVKRSRKGLRSALSAFRTSLMDPRQARMREKCWRRNRASCSQSSRRNRIDLRSRPKRLKRRVKSGAMMFAAVKSESTRKTCVSISSR